MDYTGPGPSSAVVERCLEIWDLQDLQFVRRVENFVYRGLQGGSKEVYLRLTAEGHRIQREIEAELSWLETLLKSGLQVVTPLASPSGLLHRFEEETGVFFGVLFEAAPGRAVDLETDLTPSTVQSIGDLLANLHLRNVPQSVSSGRRSFREEYFTRVIEGELDPRDGAPFNLYQELKAWMGSLSQDHYGLVHADLHHGNLFLHQGQIVPIDFDDSCLHWKTYDISIPIIHIRMDHELRARGGAVDWVMPELLRSYGEKAPFPSHFSAEIENFMTLRVLTLFHWFKYWWKAELEDRSESVKDWITKAQRWTGDFLENRRLY